MPFFQKRPIVIEAVQFTGRNDAECLAFCPIAIDPVTNQPTLSIPTLEGDMIVTMYDWIIKGVKGEFYPCKPDIFEATYTEVDHDHKLDETKV